MLRARAALERLGRGAQQPGGAQDVVSQRRARLRRLAHVAVAQRAVLAAVQEAARRRVAQPRQAAALARDAGVLRRRRRAVVRLRAVRHDLLRRVRPDPQQPGVQPARPVVPAYTFKRNYYTIIFNVRYPNHP